MVETNDTGVGGFTLVDEFPEARRVLEELGVFSISLADFMHDLHRRRSHDGQRRDGHEHQDENLVHGGYQPTIDSFPKKVNTNRSIFSTSLVLLLEPTGSVSTHFL